MQTEGQHFRRSLTPKLAPQPNLNRLQPGLVAMKPICSHSLENSGPETQMRGAIGVALNRGQVDLASQRLRGDQLGDLTQP